MNGCGKRMGVWYGFGRDGIGCGLEGWVCEKDGVWL